MQGSVDGNYGDSMRLKKNFVIVSTSVAGTVRNKGADDGKNNLFGTAILDLVAGDQVISFNCMIIK